uniref:Uncharacterized protein ycf21 n=1 Tax=Cyanophora paradoxa TaxID=2762 RepID=YCF21_CYAPA|nr:hypothetical protein CypaCp147 [Cyanophora paradoxa]P48358.1 RecName: Full=Uncharacterized protein ycf21 [Cyanophora paradoxa]AAA81315.1 ycf21 [Cyanophora paradoxa]
MTNFQLISDNLKEEKIEFEILWIGQSELFYKGIESTLIDKYWQFLLLNDGSLTKQLQLLKNKKIKRKLLEESPINFTTSFISYLTQPIKIPIIQRNIFLYSNEVEPLIYATSWWSENTINSFFLDKEQPIWSNLAQLKIEFYRDLRKILLINSKSLEKQFNKKGPFWSRYYLIWYNNFPITIIFEIFSPIIKV